MNRLKHILFATVFLLEIQGVVAQKDIFIHPEFELLAKSHQTLAILPFFVDLELKNEPSEFLRRQFNEIEGLAVQQALSHYFENKTNNKNFKVRFQPLSLTQKKLQMAGLDYRGLTQKTSQELAEILEVDGIISGTLALSVRLSDGIDKDFNWLDLWILSPEFGRMSIKISDRNTGKLLWRYEKAIDRHVGKNTEELIEKLMKQAARNFPYLKSEID
ncbi:MAG: hypothetical protein RLZZ242_105 [Bacteroidota bacterium]